MEISPILLFWLLISSACLGVVVGMLNDVHRISRILLGVQYSKKNINTLYRRNLPFLKRPLKEIQNTRIQKVVLPIVMAIQDICLFLFSAIGIVVLNYYYNDGQFRYYTVLVVLFGFLIYYFTLGKLLILISEYLVFVLRSTFVVLCWLFCRPFYLLVGFFWKKSKNIYAKVEKTIAKKQKMVYNIDKNKQVFKNAAVGFLMGWK